MFENKTQEQAKELGIYVLPMPFSINDETFFEGINLAIREGFWDGDDIGDIDGWVGDAIIQYAVFGEQVYG